MKNLFLVSVLLAAISFGSYRIGKHRADHWWQTHTAHWSTLPVLLKAGDTVYVYTNFGKCPDEDDKP